jgi:hypothetical protein
MAAVIRARMIDNSGETSTVAFPTEGQEAIDTFSAPLADSAAWLLQLEAISLLNVASVTFVQETASGTEGIPEVDYANREAGIRFIMRGAETGKRYTLTVPGPDEAALERIWGTDQYLMTASPLSGFITFLENNYRPLTNPGNLVPDHEAVAVERVIHVGRNN